MSDEEKKKATSEPAEAANAEADSKDVHRLKLGDREFILVGTAHISKQSTELVRRVIEEEKPDTVCVELDQRRYETISKPNQWDKLNLLQIIKKKQLPTLIVQLVLSSYQKRMGEQLGVLPGTELLEATRVAEENGIPFELCDRDVGITLKRAWRNTGVFKRMWLMSSLLAGMFDKVEVTEEQIQAIKDQDALTEMLNDIGEAAPSMKAALIDERDEYMAEKIRSAKGKKIVAVVGAGHVKGMLERFKQEAKADLEKLEALPPPSHFWKYVALVIPLVIIGSLIVIGYTKGFDEAMSNLKFWVLVNSIPTALGACLALAHPLVILAAFIVAPFTSLTPVVGAGMVTAFLQAWLRPPRVYELESAGSDIGHFTKWWSNRLLRVFLTFFLPGLLGAIATYVGVAKILNSAM
ncbi:MAG: pheromone shutdown-related protein TraB [Limisphaerales bacterium]|jgi:pheromone shutdown-related protein TraB